ncbi:hypothetical protein BDD43_0882 [Mucilaginibacter gracilis]|uniref:Uncharacterized protein n=1 Tax=Mucilaginibacter gracilis TaxID=423350 RepID=A0A495IXG1_9SPHI|nr:hypothetical protein BDD43_0882 [Mucilaginibacter gracilis]
MSKNNQTCLVKLNASVIMYNNLFTHNFMIYLIKGSPEGKRRKLGLILEQLVE